MYSNIVIWKREYVLAFFIQYIYDACFMVVLFNKQKNVAA